jgi:hypothetical protein
MFWSPRYLASKRDVEDYLQNHSNEIRSVVLRPGFLWDQNDTGKRVTASVLNLIHKSDAVFDAIGWQAGKEMFSPSRALSVEAVGKAAVLSAMRPQLAG